MTFSLGISLLILGAFGLLMLHITRIAIVGIVTESSHPRLFKSAVIINMMFAGVGAVLLLAYGAGFGAG